jgi:hypothetical protein
LHRGFAQGLGSVGVRLVGEQVTREAVEAPTGHANLVVVSLSQQRLRRPSWER